MLAKYIYEISGINIEASKAYLIETRLGRILESENCDSYSEFYQKAKKDASKVLEKKVIDAITTNETLFFRDGNPFELLKHKILPEIIDRRSATKTLRPIRIWSAVEIERGLPRDRLHLYFTPDGANWKIKDAIRSMASFQKLNLMHPFSALGKFDIIFCRNVAIYFTLEDRKKLFSKMADALEPDGYMIIGSTESLTGVCPRFVPKRHLKSIFYQLR
ncbi:MAG: CheR family methyltransferase [Desulfobacteraceae bacterium]